MNRVQKIEAALRATLEVKELLIKDQSHLHAGHAGAQEGLGHFDLRIVSDAFEGHSRIQRHQIIYSAVGDLMKTDIHALSIRALTSAEAVSSQSN